MPVGASPLPSSIVLEDPKKANWWKEKIKKILELENPQDIQLIREFGLYHINTEKSGLNIARGQIQVHFPHISFDEPYIKETHGLINIMEQMSTDSLKAVLFQDLVCTAIVGEPVYSAIAFCNWYGKLSQHISTHLRKHPEDIERYQNAEKVFSQKKTFSPFTLLALRCALNSSDPLNVTEARLMDMITPIRRLFETDFRGTLYSLPILEERFEHLDSDSLDANKDWDEKVCCFTELKFIFEVVSSRSAIDLASRLTKSDLAAFGNLTKNDMKHMRQSELIRDLCARWYNLSNEVADCCRVYPYFWDILNPVVVHLFNIRNWYTLAAVVKGVAKYDSKVGVQYADHFKTDETYRELMKEKPGLPFLGPHLNMLSRGRKSGLERIFPLKRKAKTWRPRLLFRLRHRWRNWLGMPSDDSVSQGYDRIYRRALRRRIVEPESLDKGALPVDSEPKSRWSKPF
ncbi:MAG: hypothetical protein M1834_000946 [Cirrosporium novae-zelandiae]|nr:MAG: hypothetical protein M1834_000946 [Cirrosporium novae-zelandiae]